VQHPKGHYSSSAPQGFRDTEAKGHSISFRRKEWKANKKAKRLVLGSDVGLEDTCRMALCSLVGHVSYKSLSKGSLEDWIKHQWVSILGYFPELTYLTKGWLGIMCNIPEDATLLLSSLWVFRGSNLMLKCWRIAFNPDSHYFQLRQLWVLLPGLPLFLWNEAALKAIGDTLECFIALDTKLLNSSQRKMGRVLVEIDIYNGFPETIEIEWRG